MHSMATYMVHCAERLKLHVPGKSHPPHQLLIRAEGYKETGLFLYCSASVCVRQNIVLRSIGWGY